LKAHQFWTNNRTDDWNSISTFRETGDLFYEKLDGFGTRCYLVGNYDSFGDTINWDIATEIYGGNMFFVPRYSFPWNLNLTQKTRYFVWNFDPEECHSLHQLDKRNLQP